MRTFIFLPPVRKPTGGVAVLYQIARWLHENGHPAFLVPRDPGTWRPEDAESVSLLPWDDLRLEPDDTWLVPEGWINALTPGLQAGARCVVYVQNWAYLFSSLPENVDWRSLPVSFLAVSDPVRWYIRETTGHNPPILRPGIDLSLFHPASCAGDGSHIPPQRPAGPVRVAYMPRKNKALADQIQQGFTARRYGKAPVQFVAIDGMTGPQVAETLASCHIFLGTGFPEGCPLPPLEALACGCLYVGFSGFGGWDYLRQADDGPTAFAPWWPLRSVPWQGNALVVADADVPGAVMALDKAVGWVETDAPQWQIALENARRTVQHYTLDHQRKAVLELAAGGWSSGG
ncbi:MAG: glycosyltransferase family 1 protein [Desulfovibrio sp.]|uniref:glycosyltransferase family 1 protein n=1 Tax=Desulfovibrio sp. 7SRBS1 TaxID=3378064 RepID=UPI003B3F2504